jgi:hypothetical protein
MRTRNLSCRSNRSLGRKRRPARPLARLSVALTVAAAGLAASTDAQAADVTRVATAFEDNNVFDVHFGVAYDFNYKRAAILREWNSGRVGDNENRLVKDLIYERYRHTLTPSVEFGLFRDLGLYFELPVVLSDSRKYSFDQRADDCVFGSPGGSPVATCVNKGNSTTLRDEIIPTSGFDATNTGNPYLPFGGPDSELIFQGPVRRGLDQLHIGLKYAVLNQAKRSHMPTWVLAFEGRFAVGKAQTFSRNIQGREPDGNGRVGRRIHELGVWTALSRRYRFLDPYFTAHWRQSIRASGSMFQDFSSEGSQTSVNPQSQAGLSVGTEIVPWERKAKNLKVAVVLQGSSVLHYGGRGYSEIWELLADSPAMVGSYDPTTQAVDANGNPTDPGFCDRGAALAFARQNPGDPGYLAAGGSSCQKFEGVTDLQDYATFGFTGGLNLTLGKVARFGLGVTANTDTRHFITSAGRGDADLAGSGGTTPNEVEAGTREVNPVRRDVVDNVGRRYAVDDVLDLHAFARLTLVF